MELPNHCCRCWRTDPDESWRLVASIELDIYQSEDNPGIVAICGSCLIEPVMEPADADVQWAQLKRELIAMDPRPGDLIVIPAGEKEKQLAAPIERWADYRKCNVILSRTAEEFEHYGEETKEARDVQADRLSQKEKGFFPGEQVSRVCFG